MNVVLVLILGALGGLAREYIQDIGVVGTLLVNLLGMFAAGMVTALMDNRKLTERMHTVVTIGFIGSFTTYSSFMTDTVQISRSNILIALIYVLGTVFSGFVLFGSGSRLMRFWVHIGSAEQPDTHQQQSANDGQTFAKPREHTMLRQVDGQE